MSYTKASKYGLGFETSSAWGSVALGRGAEIIEVRRLSGPRMHAVEFIPTIKAICAAHQVEPRAVERVYVSSGPGSFTGLRIGVTTARMIGLAGGAEIVSVPTLEVIAQNALDFDRGGGSADQPPDRVIVLLDAKRGRVYAGVFDRTADRYVAVDSPVEADPAQFLADHATDERSCAVLGEGVLYHWPAVEASGHPILCESNFAPRAETVYRLGILRAAEGKFADRRKLTPTYVRLPEAEEKWQQRERSG